MGEVLTKVHFAQRCGHLTRLVASWGAESLDLLDEIDQPMRPPDVFRFTDEVRARLDHLDKQAGRTHPTKEADRG